MHYGNDRRNPSMLKARGWRPARDPTRNYKPVATLGIGIIIAWFPLAIVSIWFIYRIGRGWIALNNRRLMYGCGSECRC